MKVAPYCLVSASIRGESVHLSKYHQLEDFIDPSTLAPDDDNDEDEDDEEMDEPEFEHTLSTLASDMVKNESVVAKPPKQSQLEQVDWEQCV
jgi:hypothetical protein